MKLANLFELLGEAGRLSGHAEFVVIGSLSILALADAFAVPADMTLSNDIDCYTKADPDRIFDLLSALGENSAYHQARGYFLDAVTPALPSLPAGWEARMNRVERGAVVAWFLEPNDAALSKYARGEPRDRRWIRAGIRCGVVSIAVVRSRLKSVDFLDDAEQQRATMLVAQDEAWFRRLRG